MSLDLGEFLADIKSKLGGRVGAAFEKIQDAVNQLGVMTGADPTQFNSTPTPPNAINVAAGSDHIHVTLEDNTTRTRAHNYFVEWSANDPNFLAPHMEHLGVGRGRVLALPAKLNADDDAPINYYVRGYSHAIGAKSASAKITFGGTVPTPINLTGSSALNVLPSTGGGTAPSNGQKPGQGFGTNLNARQQ
jgi:hypothetical protein